MAVVVAPTEGWDSFLSAADADAYWNGLTVGAAWNSATPADKDRALRLATNYLWAKNLRLGAWAPEVNVNLANATAEAAIRVLQGKIGRDPDVAPVIQKTVGPITLRYAEPGSSTAPNFQVIEDMLYGLTVGGLPFAPIMIERV